MRLCLGPRWCLLLDFKQSVDSVKWKQIYGPKGQMKIKEIHKNQWTDMKPTLLKVRLMLLNKISAFNTSLKLLFIIIKCERSKHESDYRIVHKVPFSTEKINIWSCFIVWTNSLKQGDTFLQFCPHFKSTSWYFRNSDKGYLVKFRVQMCTRAEQYCFKSTSKHQLFLTTVEIKD